MGKLEFAQVFGKGIGIILVVSEDADDGNPSVKLEASTDDGLRIIIRPSWAEHDGGIGRRDCFFNELTYEKAKEYMRQASRGSIRFAFDMKAAGAEKGEAK